MRYAVMLVLERLSHYNGYVSWGTERKSILEFTKRNRKGLTKEEIYKKGLNIYEKRDNAIDFLLNGLIQAKAVNRKDNEVCITTQGRNLLMDLYTDEYCPDFLKFAKDVCTLTEKYNEPDFEDLHIGKMYYKQWDLEKIEQTYFNEDIIQQETREFHEYMLKVYGIQLEDGYAAFHLLPKLLLPKEVSWQRVELTIEGIDLPGPIIPIRPYPNKRYVVAGFRVDNQLITTGFYPIVAKKQDFPEKMDICFRWKLENGNECIHNVTFYFEFDKGNLFSNIQRLSRSNNLDELSIYTLIPEELPGNENYLEQYIGNDGITTCIKEEFFLTSFPKYLHHFTYADENFKKWSSVKKID